MTVRDFLRRTNNHVKWRLTDRLTGKSINTSNNVLDKKSICFFRMMMVH